jgi:hypothetical protein
MTKGKKGLVAVRAERKQTERFVVSWQQVRPAGTTRFGENCKDRQTAQDFIVGWLWNRNKADGVVYVARQQCDAAGKWQTVETEELTKPEEASDD